MAVAGTQAWFAVAATAMVVVAGLFVLPWPRRRAAAVPAEGRVAARPAWRRVTPWLALPAAAVALYLALGDPAAINPQRSGLSAQLREPDAPLDESTARMAYAELQQHLQRQPGDARAWVLKARLDMQAQRYQEAAAAYERALKGPAKTAGDAGLWVEYAEARGMLQGGTLAGQPRQLVDKALALNPELPQALDLGGSAAWEAGEFALAASHWQRLLAQIPPGSPRHVQLANAIARAELKARFALPTPR